jgi:hypothetical protein
MEFAGHHSGMRAARGIGSNDLRWILCRGYSKEIAPKRPGGPAPDVEKGAARLAKSACWLASTAGRGTAGRSRATFFIGNSARRRGVRSAGNHAGRRVYQQPVYKIRRQDRIGPVLA